MFLHNIDISMERNVYSNCITFMGFLIYFSVGKKAMGFRNKYVKLKHCTSDFNKLHIVIF